MTGNLIVIADDYGIGPETSRGILELALLGRIDGTVLLVNSPFAADAVARWRAAGRPVELGWHPNLTLDRPITPRRRVPSLVRGDGSFHSLGSFLIRLGLGLVRRDDLETELRAQFHRYLELVGTTPTLVNSHQHVAVFPPVREVLIDLLAPLRPVPYLRAVVEPAGMWWRVAGARFKRLVLTWFGRVAMQRASRSDLFGADCLLGLTNPGTARHPDALTRWLRPASETMPGRVAELMCHPGYADETLREREGRSGEGWASQRVGELELLRGTELAEACDALGFVRTAPARLNRGSGRSAA